MKDKHIILYDGVCKMCNGFILFIINRDKDDKFRFISLTSERAAEVFKQIRLDPEKIDSLVLVKNFQRDNQTVFIKSDSVLKSVAQLGGKWRYIVILNIFPKVVRDLVYEINARLRHRLWGKYTVCPIPSSEIKHKFID